MLPSDTKSDSINQQNKKVYFFLDTYIVDLEEVSQTLDHNTKFHVCIIFPARRKIISGVKLSLLTFSPANNKRAHFSKASQALPSIDALLKYVP